MPADEILERALASAQADPNVRDVTDDVIYDRLTYVCRCLSNRACIRLLMACLLAKVDNPDVDPRKPYTEIGTSDCFSGRTYDERFLTHFINQNNLPCNPTTAFLTPAFRRGDHPLSTDTTPMGRPKELYVSTIQLLDYVQNGRVSAMDMLIDATRILIGFRDEKAQRMRALLADLQTGKDALPLSSEGMVTLIEQHLACRNSSRLPVLVVAAAYQAAGAYFGEHLKELNAHNAADFQTGAVGDVEVYLTDDDVVVTAYEMKSKQVTINDIDLAQQKIASHQPKIQNYIFITTDTIEQRVFDYAKQCYEDTGGTEFAILDCIGFLRHFLHFFHRLRTDFLNNYQRLVLNEPDSAISQPLKEAFLALRQAAESGE